MPQNINLSPNRLENNRSDMEGIKDWLLINKLSPIKNIILNLLFNYGAKHFPLETETVDSWLKEMYSVFNEIFKNAGHEISDLEFCCHVGNQLNTLPKGWVARSNSLKEIKNKAIIFVSVFNKPSTISLRAKWNGLNFEPLNKLTMEYFEVRFLQSNFTHAKNYLLKDLINFAKINLVPEHFCRNKQSFSEYQAANDIFNACDLPDILFFHLVIDRINRVSGSTELRKEILQQADFHYKLLVEPHVVNTMKIAFLGTIFFLALPTLRIPCSEKVSTNGALLCALLGLFAEQIVKMRIHMEMVSQMKPANAGKLSERGISGLADQPEKSLLATLSFLTQGIRAANVKVKPLAKESLSASNLRQLPDKKSEATGRGILSFGNR